MLNSWRSALVAVALGACALSVSAQFTPPAGQVLWLSADTGVVKDGADAVSQWQDQSGNGNHAVPPAATNQPTWEASVDNGRAGIHFDGTDDFFALPNLMSGATAGEIFLLIRADAYPPTATGRTGIYAFGTSPNSHYSWVDGLIYDDFGSTTRHNGISPGTPLSSFNIYDVSSGSGVWTARLNGNIIRSESTGVAFNSAPTLGRSASTYFFDGHLIEVQVYDRVLTPAERADVNVHLANSAFDTEPPTTPENLVGCATDVNVSLSWDAATDNGPVVTYEVYRDAVLVGTTSLTSYLDGVAPDTTYVYTVRAVDYAGNLSAPSAPLSVTTESTTVEVPELPSLRLWLKADSCLLLSPLNQIAVWPDASNAGNDAYQTLLGAEPVWVDQAFGDHPAVRFDGVDDFLYLQDFISDASAGEIFIVMRVDNDPPFAPSATGIWAFGAGQNSHHPWTNGLLYDAFGSSSRHEAIIPGIPLDVPHIYNVSSGPGQWIARLNGVDVRNENNAVFFTTAPKLGAAASGPYFLDGDVAEVLVYGEVLDELDRLEIESYLTNKYFNTAPVAQCQDLSVSLDNTGNAAITAAQIDDGSSDADGDSLSLSVAPDAFTCAELGGNTVTLTVDDGNGGVDTCTATVTVLIGSAPLCADIETAALNAVCAVIGEATSFAALQTAVTAAIDAALAAATPCDLSVSACRAQLEQTIAELIAGAQ